MKAYVIILAFAIISCEPLWKKEDLIGSWQSVSWIEVDSGRAIPQPMALSFSLNDDYSLDNGSGLEHGVFQLEGDYIHFLADGQNPYALKFNALSPDTLILDMNRAGKLERIVFTRPSDHKKPL